MLSENGSWDAEVTYDMIQDKLGYLNSYGINNGNCFDPLSKIISGGNDPFVPFRRKWCNKANKIKPPTGKRPWWCNGL